MKGKEVVSAVSSFRSRSRGQELCTWGRAGMRGSEREEQNFTWFNFFILHRIILPERRIIRMTRNSFPIIPVIDHISFTVAEEINFLLDSNTASAYFTHLTFHLSPSIYTLWHLIKWPSSTYTNPFCIFRLIIKLSHFIFHYLQWAINHSSHYYCNLITCVKWSVNSAAQRCLY